MDMAIFHLSAKIIARSAGRSATASAAYRAAERIRDDRTGITFDYRRKKEVSYRKILVPLNAPEWATDRSRLWNEAEKAEARKDAQVAREIELSLPIELTLTQQVILLERFVCAEFTSQGMIADICIHDKPGNPHAHILLTTRVVSAVGFGQKNRGWNTKKQLERWREQWAVRANRRLAIAGSKACIDHRTLNAQGIQRLSTVHVGAASKAMNGRGIWSVALEINHFIKESNMNEKCRKENGGKKGEEPTVEKKKNKPEQFFVSMPIDIDSQSKRSQWERLFDRGYLQRLKDIFSDYWLSVEPLETDSGYCLRLNFPSGAIYDYGSYLKCDGGTDEEVEVLVRLAKEKGWSGIHLTGPEDFKEKVFVRALRTGAFSAGQITGYEPTSKALARACHPSSSKNEVDADLVRNDDYEPTNKPKKLKL